MPQRDDSKSPELDAVTIEEAPGEAMQLEQQAEEEALLSAGEQEEEV
jgi:hypothetical protein